MTKPNSLDAKGPKWPGGRSRLCPKCFAVYCSPGCVPKFCELYFTRRTCHPNILRNCNKSLNILDIYLLPPAAEL